MIVVDASAVLELLLNRASGAAVRNRLFATGETLHAPHLLDVEVLQVIRRYSLTREMSEDRAREAVAHHLALPIERYSHQFLVDRIWELRANLTAYDAAYVALAELLDAPLLTSDARLAKAAPATASVEVIRG